MTTPEKTIRRPRKGTRAGQRGRPTNDQRLYERIHQRVAWSHTMLVIYDTAYEEIGVDRKAIQTNRIEMRNDPVLFLQNDPTRRSNVFIRWDGNRFIYKVSFLPDRFWEDHWEVFIEMRPYPCFDRIGDAIVVAPFCWKGSGQGTPWRDEFRRIAS